MKEYPQIDKEIYNGYAGEARLSWAKYTLAHKEQLRARCLTERARKAFERRLDRYQAIVLAAALRGEDE